MRISGIIASGGEAKFELCELELEEPRDDELLIRISGVGICHTDLWFSGQLPGPAMLGHEGSGVVEAVGASVTDFAAGDKVILSFASCGSCHSCEQGLPAYCDRMFPINFGCCRPDGSTSLTAKGKPVGSHFFGQSSFASHAVVYARNAVKVPATSTALELLGPLGCGLQTGAGAILSSLDCHAGQSVAIAGCGTVGLAAVMAAKARNCAAIIAIDPLSERRELALEFGATVALDPLAGDIDSMILAHAQHGMDRALDTTSRPEIVAGLLRSLTRLGILGLVGSPTPGMAGEQMDLMGGGRSIRGIIQGDSDPKRFIPELLAMHERGDFPFDRLIKTYPLAEIEAAIHDQHSGNCVKAVLLP